MLYISDNAHLMSRQVAKFHGVTRSDPKILGANKLHFKPIFGPSLEKNVEGTLISCGVWASKTWPFCGACKNFGVQHRLEAEICMVFRKSRFCGHNCTSKSP